MRDTTAAHRLQSRKPAALPRRHLTSVPCLRLVCGPRYRAAQAGGLHNRRVRQGDERSGRGAGQGDPLGLDGLHRLAGQVSFEAALECRPRMPPSKCPPPPVVLATDTIRRVVAATTTSWARRTGESFRKETHHPTAALVEPDVSLPKCPHEGELDLEKILTFPPHGFVRLPGASGTTGPFSLRTSAPRTRPPAAG